MLPFQSHLNLPADAVAPPIFRHSDFTDAGLPGNVSLVFVVLWLVSVNDAAFMEQVGIVLENPYQRVWWIIAVQQIEERPPPYFAQ